MDYYAPTHEALVRPWRTRTIVATSIAALELLALSGLAIAYFGKHWFTDARAAEKKHAVAKPHHATVATRRVILPVTTPQAPKTPERPMLARRHTEVLVLNGNGLAGAAGAMAQTLKARRYPISAVGNAKRSDYARSMVMYLPGYGREAQRLAHDMRIPIVTVLDGLKPSELDGAKLAVVIGRG